MFADGDLITRLFCWLFPRHRAEIAYIRRAPKGDSTLVTRLDLLTFAAADHCDGERWIAPQAPRG
jgi:hypothetical protein